MGALTLPPATNMGAKCGPPTENRLWQWGWAAAQVLHEGWGFRRSGDSGGGEGSHPNVAPTLCRGESPGYTVTNRCTQSKVTEMQACIGGTLFKNVIWKWPTPARRWRAGLIRKQVRWSGLVYLSPHAASRPPAGAAARMLREARSVDSARVFTYWQRDQLENW